MVSKRQLAYAEEVNGIINSYNVTALSYTLRIKELLFEAQRRMTGIINDISQQDWEAGVFAYISQDINKVLNEFRTDYDAVMLASLRDASLSGVDIVRDPLMHNLDFSTVFGEPTFFRSAVNDVDIRAFWNLSTSLIGTATQEAGQKINDTIILGMITGESRTSVINKITGQLAGEKEGVKNLNARAWSIYRTETAKMYSYANERQIRSALEYIPNAEKQWHHGWMSGLGQRPRQSHIALDGMIIPMNESFFDSATGDMLRYPHDPLASPSSFINCSCVHTLALPSDKFIKNETVLN